MCNRAAVSGQINKGHSLNLGPECLYTMDAQKTQVIQVSKVGIVGSLGFEVG